MKTDEKLARARKRKPKARLMCSAHPKYTGLKFPSCDACLVIWRRRRTDDLGWNSHGP
jgi:hypothetical protein